MYSFCVCLIQLCLFLQIISIGRFQDTSPFCLDKIAFDWTNCLRIMQNISKVISQQGKLLVKSSHDVVA